MVLFTDSSFPAVSVETANIPVANPTDPVNIILSSGVTETVFDNVNTALKCLAFMVSRNQYFLQASEDLMIVNISGVKLLIVETTFLNQKLLNSYNLSYSRGKVVCTHRNMSSIESLTDALTSVGYKKSSGTAFENNYDLEVSLSQLERPFLKVVDVKYKSTVVNSTEGSLLTDATAISY